MWSAALACGLLVHAEPACDAMQCDASSRGGCYVSWAWTGDDPKQMPTLDGCGLVVGENLRAAAAENERAHRPAPGKLTAQPVSTG